MLIHIKYNRGAMTIDLSKFFPTTITNFKKLLDVIDLDYAHRQDNYDALYNFLDGYFRKGGKNVSRFITILDQRS